MKWLLRRAGFLLFFGSFLLTSCVNQNPLDEPQKAVPPTVTRTSTTTPTETPEAELLNLEDLKGEQIHFWHPWNGETQEVLLQMIDQFNQGNAWGIHVIMEDQGSAGLNDDNIWKAIEDLTPPQVIAVSPQTLLAIQEKNQLIVDLNKYVNSEKIGLTTKQIDDFYPGFWEEDVQNGRRFGIPVQRGMTVLFYNTSWAKELGFSTVPETPEDMQAQLCSANRTMRQDTDFTNDGIGGMLISKDSGSMLGWIAAFGSRIQYTEGFKFNSLEIEKAYQYLLSLSRDACAWERKNAQPYDYFAKRQTLAYSGQLQDIPAQTAANIRNGSEDVWGIIPFPGIKGGVAITNGISLGILDSDEDKNLASWLFIRWLSEPAQQARLLTTFNTLPLGDEVINLVPEIGNRYPQWNTARRYLEYQTPTPLDADWNVIKQVVEDSAWQLFNPGTTSTQVGIILTQTDELAAELSLKYP